MDRRYLGVLRPKTRRRSVPATILTSSLLALGLSGPAATSAYAAERPSASTRFTAVRSASLDAPDTYEQRVQRLVNVRRSSHGLPTLRLTTCADVTAETWSRYLALLNEFFHQSMDTVLDHCDATYAGETLGRGSMTPGRLVHMWMQSPPHRAVLLNQTSRGIGVGATYDAFGRLVVAANFVRF